MKHSAQASLELAIVIAAFLSMFLLLLPSIHALFDAGIFSFDVKNAQQFLHSFKETARQLSVFSSGSEKTIESAVLTKWVIYSKQNKVFLQVHSEEAGKTKLLEAELPLTVEMQELELQKEARLRLVKSSSHVLVVNG
ncbi:MAG: hypothetical protein J4224_01485 [Candidatus Diapherotrites archaeon]|uniref:HNH endonuclease n=1 Tax=Candidatus Iainarchaeum sp. TaxID=3101447 RepID=A0A7J4IRL2_9ARCH|nr:MAG: hypothetical protein QT03_C0001G1230 [archaeon GW2011_AR10]MBS3059077.1 hypothetical protein [Candidatus Diapherotrites archaeon]HIH08153.1 HNH endonuclease [Candidatus Diapherotrites archaeon]